MFPTRPGDVIAAGADFGFRSDSSALAIVNRRADVYRVIEVCELRPQDGAPLKPSETVSAFALRMKAHGAAFLMADIHYRETIREHLEAHRLEYVAAPARPVDAYMRARALFREGKVRLPNNQRMLQQLREVQGKPLAGGGMSIVHPRWASGGHGDIADAVIYGLFQLAGVEVKAVIEKGTPEWEEAEAEKRRKAAREAARKGNQAWWKR